MISRRSLLTGGTALLIAAPALVRAQSLMPIRVMEWEGLPEPEVGRYTLISHHWPDGSYYKEVADLFDRTSHVELQHTSLGIYKSGPRLSLEAAEYVYQAFEDAMKSPAIFRRKGIGELLL